MNRVSAPNQTRIPIGYVVVAGKSLECTINDEWAKFFESLVIAVNANTSEIAGMKSSLAGVSGMLMGAESGGGDEQIPGPQGLPGLRGEPGPAIGMLDSGGDSMNFMPGPPGPQGTQGDPGPAVFMLQDDSGAVEQMFQPQVDISGKASLSGATFTGAVVAPRFQTATGSSASVSATPVTLYTIPTAAPAVFLVSANIGTTNDAVNYSAYSVIVADGTSARIVYNGNGPLQTITLSGLNIQSTQSSGGAQTINMTVTRIN